MTSLNHWELMLKSFYLVWLSNSFHRSGSVSFRVQGLCSHGIIERVNSVSSSSKTSLAVFLSNSIILSDFICVTSSSVGITYVVIKEDFPFWNVMSISNVYRAQMQMIVDLTFLIVESQASMMSLIEYCLFSKNSSSTDWKIRNSSRTI